jgi:hypothetical protein
MVVRLSTPDVEALKKNFDDRVALKERHGCTASRLLLDSQDAKAAVILMDFPSVEAAKAYTAASIALLGPGELSGMTGQRVEYLEEVPSALSPSD